MSRATRSVIFPVADGMEEVAGAGFMTSAVDMGYPFVPMPQ